MIIAGTGHRPDKLGGYGQEAADRLERLAYNWLHLHMPEKVISGGALGWDQALARASYHHGIPYVMALPFKDFDSKWPVKSRDNLTDLINYADEIVYVCDEGYAPWKMQERNKWMVDNCNILLALWNVTDGGTHNCIKYANSIGRQIINLWDKYD